VFNFKDLKANHKDEVCLHKHILKKYE